MIGLLSILGAVGSIAYVNSASVGYGDRTQQIIYWINFGLHIALTLIWIASEVMKCNGNHSGHSSTVLTFGIVYIILFLVDIATGAIMIIWGAGFIIWGGVTVFGSDFSDTVGSSFNAISSPNTKTTISLSPAGSKSGNGVDPFRDAANAAVGTAGTVYVIIGICLIAFAIVMFTCQIHYLCVIFGHRKLYK